MERKVGNFFVSNDGLQWIVQKEYLGKDKDGNDKLMRGDKKYFSRFDLMCKHVSNDNMMEFWNTFSETTEKFFSEQLGAKNE